MMPPFKPSLKYLAIILLCGCLTAGAALAAPQTLWPTDLTSTGDCVSDTLSAPMNAMQAKVDKDFCTAGNEGNRDAIQNCILNSATKTEVMFFTDKCGSEGDNTAFLSVNGKEYRVTRLIHGVASPANFTGTYEGEGITISIRTEKPIPDNSNEDDSGLKTIRMRAPVAITLGTETQSFEAVFSHSEVD